MTRVPQEALRKSFQDHSSPLPLNLGLLKDICHIPMDPSTQRNISLSKSPILPHPNTTPIPTSPGVTHQLPILEPCHLGGWKAICVTLQSQGLPG